jgi:hypothetical protein
MKDSVFVGFDEVVGTAVRFLYSTSVYRELKNGAENEVVPVFGKVWGRNRNQEGVSAHSI